jgi:hypothetical protein
MGFQGRWSWKLACPGWQKANLVLSKHYLHVILSWFWRWFISLLFLLTLIGHTWFYRSSAPLTQDPWKDFPNVLKMLYPRSINRHFTSLSILLYLYIKCANLDELCKKVTYWFWDFKYELIWKMLHILDAESHMC